MKNATETAMNLLTAVMKNGKVARKTAEKVLCENHACRLVTLSRAKLVVVDCDWVKTVARWEADKAKAEKAERVKALKAEVARLTAELARETA